MTLRWVVMLAGLLAIAAPVQADPGFPSSQDDQLADQGRMLIAKERPDVIRHMLRKDGFGGAGSPIIARSMLAASPEHIKAVREGMTVARHGPDVAGQRMWLLRFPYVNVGLIETKRGLVLFDTGYAAIGPVLADVIPTLSKKPVTHIIVSHIHNDHAYGWPAVKAKWPKAKTITSDLFPAMAAKEVRVGGSIGRYNNQPLASWPTSVARLPKPDIMFRDQLSLRIDGETFSFIHSPGETEEQMWLSLPARRAIFTEDYYQGFLPNAGNGKRIVRHVDEWAAAFRAMVALKPNLMLPMHSAAVEGETAIAETLTLNADALEHLSKQVVARLNAGERKDMIAATLDWPERFAKDPRLDPQYNRPEDIARMVSARWTGWWDDIPSHFPAMRFEEEAKEALHLAGGLDAVDKRARTLLPTNPKLAARLADWAYYGAPDDPRALRLTVDVYLARMLEPDMPLQEANVYLIHAAKARARLEQLGKK